MLANPNVALHVELPDFRNLGVILRVLVISEVTNVLGFVSHAPEGFAALLQTSHWGVFFEFSVLATVLVLFVLSPRLAQVHYRQGVWLVAGVAALVSAAADVGIRAVIGAVSLSAACESAVLAALLAFLILGYFNWRQRVLSPALASARLMALQSRIRPHFLFNSLNTAVALVRTDASLAERVLLDMSDLFRVLLADNRSLVPLADELRLAGAYLEIEQLRLGERLRVTWGVERAPLAVQVPILVLQPLLENAVRYGVEPVAGGGDVVVSIETQGRRLIIEVRNAILGPHESMPAGNRIALANIGERLALHFDAEGSLRTYIKGNEFVAIVCIPLPHRDIHY